MKQFRKTKDDLFICEECGNTFIRACGLGKHINVFHSKKLYYDKWLKEENEDICKYCGNKTEYTGYWHKKLGYNKYCSNVCRNKGRLNSIETTNIMKYNVKCSFSIPSTIEKRKKTFIKIYGVDNNMKSIIGFHKNFLSRIIIKHYKNTNLTYQGSYEYDFLEKFYKKYPDLKNGPSICYSKTKIYHADFYIPKLNLVVEIKNDYLANRDKEEIELKKKATVVNGFNYIMIINKKYNLFKNYIRSQDCCSPL